jgi:hypothetical protein
LGASIVMNGAGMTASAISAAGDQQPDELPTWHAALGRVIDLLGVLHEQVARIDVAEGAVADEAALYAASVRDFLLKDIEAALLAANGAQRRVAGVAEPSAEATP